MTAGVKDKMETAVFFSSDFAKGDAGGQPTFSHEDREGHDVLVVKNMPIFRSGEFRDSMGFAHIFDPFHMAQAQANFEFLRQGILPDVPVRAGHPSPFTNSMNEIIGHIDGLRTQEMTSPADGQKYTYLLADFHVMDEVAASKIEKGLWRNRSSEIGLYESNGGMEFWPALVGFAYVDIPAVEGLNGAFSHYAKEPIGQGAYLIGDINKEDAPVATEQKTTPATPPAAPPKIEASAAPVAQHTFTIAGKETTDFAAVQAHIASLEAQAADFAAAQKEMQDTNRKEAIAKWIAEGKEFASDQATLEEFGLGLSADQWSKFAAIRENAPVRALFGKHEVSPEAGGTPAPSEQDKDDAEVASAKRRFNHLKIGGMSLDKLAKTSSGQLLASKGIDLATL